MAERRVFCAVALTLLAGCILCGSLWSLSAAKAPNPVGTDLAGLLPPPSLLAGWRIAEGPVEYIPDTLYERLDGAAPRYLSYGFRRLLNVRYELGGDLLASVTLDVFDMGDVLGAFGIYRSGLPRGAALREWGAEGHRSGTVAAAWKGNVYVHVEADDDRPALIDMLERLVAQVCEAVAAEPSLPAILSPLPPEGRVPRSERYVAKDLHGHAFLPGGVVAMYEIEGHEAELFFSDLGSRAGAGDAMAKLRAHEKKRGRIVRDLSSIGTGGFQFTDPTLGSGTVVGAGRYVAGVCGDLPYRLQERLLVRLVENLGSSGTKD
jgi:hypothetical protein